MKTCSKCKIEKPFSDFYKRKAVKDGVQSHCKLCVHAWRRDTYMNDPEVKASRKATSKKHFAKMRIELIRAYGGRCVCCGETTPTFLSIDHIGGGGQQHRREIGEGGSAIAKFLRKNNYPKDKYRLLCYNCNCAIGFFGACPHNQSLDTLIQCASSF